MNKLIVLASIGLLSACMTLPGSDEPPTSRFLLSGPETACEAGGETLALSVVSVNAGLDNDRIARRNADSGEITYLRGVRWADEVGPLLEQRMAQDLECAGFAVLSAHHQKLGQQQLVCEVRALNLVENGADSAEVYLSCLYYRGRNDEVSLVIRQKAAMGRWNAESAVAAISAAYSSAFVELLDGMAQPE